MKIEITKAQLEAIINLKNDVSSMLGCSETEENGFCQDRVWEKQIKLINKMLINNKLTR